MRKKTGEPGNRCTRGLCGGLCAVATAVASGAGEPGNGGTGRRGDQRTGSPTYGNGRLKDCWGLWKLSENELEVFERIKRAWAASDEEPK